ncbi:alkaline phosphatase [Pilimelia anulata]|uniref:Alkaline phosphatase n=1 Tax=Pilimelia anulata TaxID=53371 RepID=A0A8J3B4F3_9ACTN|nr:alkaline phosphatase D family protein [Pilimelia anulata]GGJ84131.1 alkaline phosphatase [Pilimelia anulata]
MSYSGAVSRRTVLAGAAVAGAAVATGGAAIATAASALGPRLGPLRTDPFTLGVASGDPTDTGVVLWTRLAPEPLAPDGRGGMPARPVTVQWVLAADPQLRRVARRGTTQALPEYGHSVHVELAGLAPGRVYFYRFTADGYASEVGRTRTAPAPEQVPAGLRLAVASCAQYEHGYFSAYRALGAADPDLVLHLGDYLYEFAPGERPAPGGNVRGHSGTETVTLAQYRQRYAQYRTDPDLRFAHARAPWAVVYDDHEIANNWAGMRPEEPDPRFAARRAAAMRAYWENMPLRRAALPRGPDMQLYRRLRWGRLAAIHLLDTRQYRSARACGPGWRACPAAADPRRTMTGPAQERWLLDGLRDPTAQWNLIGQQVFFGRRDRDPGRAEVTRTDSWDGYPASRGRLVGAFPAARNPVLLTGDVHAHWAGQVARDLRDPASPPVAAELVCSSISSGGDGHDATPTAHPYQRLNPHLRFHNNQRGFLLLDVAAGGLTADFRSLPYVSRPGAAAFSRARFALADGDPALHRTHLQRLDRARAREVRAADVLRGPTR